MKQILNVETQNYNIIISDDNFTKFIEDISEYTRDKKCLWVISKKVYQLYKKILNLNNFNILVLKDGEKEKNFKNYIKILKKAEEIGLTRKDAIIALGGGVIGDIAGFAASTYMRGVDFIQIPTTLLSMVDSSVGGKTAIDMASAKNIVGTFYQPKQVFININFLKTLDKRQYLAGIGEVLKYAFIEENCGYKHPLFFFEYLTLCCEKLLEKEAMTLMRVIEYCLLLKISVVNQDEKESSLRKILNLGHTIGHALESRGKYNTYLHGEAVIQGLFFIFNYAYKKNLITYSYYRLSIELLEKYGFRNKIQSLDSNKLLDFIKKDKKALRDRISFIVPYEKKKVKEIFLTFAETQSALEVNNINA